MNCRGKFAGPLLTPVGPIVRPQSVQGTQKWDQLDPCGLTCTDSKSKYLLLLLVGPFAKCSGRLGSDRGTDCVSIQLIEQVSEA